MKYFLSLIMVFCSFAALAQNTEEAPLFPELSGLVTGAPAAQTDIDSVASDEEEGEAISSQEEESSSEEDLFKTEETIPQTQEGTETTAEEESEEEEEEDEKEQHIYIVIDDVKATLTPNRNASFCSAAFAVANGLKKEIKDFSGNFTIGSMTKEFKFSNVGKEQASAAKYMFVGTSCEEILNPPANTIKT